MMAKYSGVEKVRAMRATGCASATSTVAAARPPTSAATSVQPSALAASPLRAMAWPSHSIGTSIGSPGTWKRIEVQAPA
ncbi:MAG: hypothetical protein K0S03_2433 [Burkholderiales bacterium]|nr:hypothetical protein [Burkholderiales bacterium]